MSDYIQTKEISVVNNQVFINGKSIPLPPKHNYSYNITQLNNKLFINGYELKNGKWKRTLRALWHSWF